MLSGTWVQYSLPLGYLKFGVAEQNRTGVLVSGIFVCVM